MSLGVAIRSVCVLMLGAALVASCGGNPPTTRASTPPATSPPDSSPPTSSSTPMEVRGDGAVLDPGTYTYSEFAPGVTFVLDEGWTGAHLFPEFFDVQREGLLLAFADPEYVVDNESTRIDTEELTPREALETILGNEDLEAGPVRETTVGNRSGLAVDFTPAAPARLFGGPAGTFSAIAGERHRLAAVDVEGDVVLVMIRGPADDYVAGLAGAEDVVATVRLG